ncbi:MAG TPA: LysE family translocator [Ramlibacter sp.]|jgi:threonine/homoserine/homoserine lactone efflux protein|uniref:LysE family translocator n=1 Tax=Ramlibacter sp. TaxID=1917967 RepID=UPI002D3655AA|nr:LysE family translocator [Ramlibacter sp.]HZY18813.1 LysE family translocator [Ramlibacter sp.]
MLNDLLPLATYCFLMSSTPGPNNVMLTASGANFGYRGTLPHILGINAGGAVQTFATCLGLGMLFSAYPVLHAVLKVTGAAYLLYLAWRLAGAAPGEQGSARPLTWREGALFQAVNPKSWMKAATLASLFMPAGLPALQGALLVSMVGFAIGFPCVSMWALFGVAIRRALQDPRRRRAFNAIMAAMLALLALSLLL